MLQILNLLNPRDTEARGGKGICRSRTVAIIVAVMLFTDCAPGVSNWSMKEETMVDLSGCKLSELLGMC
jgi:hypothetical protein